MKLVGVIADQVGLKQLCVDVSNSYVNADTSYKIYVPAAGPEFGERDGQIIVTKRAWYGFLDSGADWFRNL